MLHTTHGLPLSNIFVTSHKHFSAFTCAHVVMGLGVNLHRARERHLIRRNDTRKKENTDGIASEETSTSAAHRLVRCLHGSFRRTETVRCDAEIFNKVVQVRPVLPTMKRLRRATREHHDSENGNFNSEVASCRQAFTFIESVSRVY